MTLGQKQKQFPLLLCKLIDFIYASGYEVTFGELWRPVETAALYAKQGKGSANSLHCIRLAADLNVFLEGRFLTDGKLYEFAGVYWESLSRDGLVCAWGGRFGDGNHFSIEHNGVR